ncbi:MAG: DUF4282 domain-containing protein [Phenylobacterium sp.]|uniref:DUF4282 domain-containing protein n=1 Tax=Phenylobacterium sp. TaxID=1871053 RepID=UPI001B4099B4|nr:DUF4282 domain-containing protein [Phenylobacterium sp.]MBP7649385.1 DUF4282 domain-containing protein [Phenylobacterium sp.]MBP7815550.1 DUF4282 domain-containing protein [Phenylobacterium sp.]MBP9230157.1 DUF4282 domain-containing protein [Phenylobacterium sp.]MBP9753615.1 DUF4282 domain-containing protein [Phenylobacterium sp.]
MRPSKPTPRHGAGASMFWDLLTFERLMTNQVIHLIYWAGLGVIALIAFGIIGTAVGVALREELFMGILLALSVLVGGFLVVGALILLWRSFCELYVAIFRLSDDLHAMRQAVDAENSVRPPAPQRKA